MNITKEILLADKAALQDQLSGLRQTLTYIDALLAFVDKPEVVDEPVTPVEE